uniref:Elongation factor Ts, mitochondrial n=1 Tax=Mucochytrium quahogii TaxID=96639 RepID=A0A7S2S642_9STRA|mmetsp:Transcript_25347/g.54691  ORF Transcript_25347/g.54691 Transcript_25347/m.54691 type:complete len:347 (+) Transcript_25347:54-1094(+)
MLALRSQSRLLLQASIFSSESMAVRCFGTKISASMVKELREQTGSPLMECKKALTASKGDMAGASDWLRKQGIAIAAKKADRATNDGLVGIMDDGLRQAAAVLVSSETDFVARNKAFVDFVSKTNKIALEGAVKDVEDLKSKGFDGQDTVATTLTNLTATLGENLDLKDARCFSSENGVVGTYIHNKRGDNAGTQGSVVVIDSDKLLEADEAEKVRNFANSLSLHLVGMGANFLDGVPDDVLAKETELETERLRKEALKGKTEAPAEDVLQKRVKKKVDKVLKKLREESVLMEQVFVSMDQDAKKQKVSKLLNSVGSSVGAKLSIPLAARFNIGVEPTILSPVEKK